MSQKLDIKDAAIIRQVLKDAIPKMKKQALNMGVCYAVSDTNAQEKFKAMTKEFVCAGIGENGWVTGWLSGHCPEYNKEYQNSSKNGYATVEFQEKIRQYRLEWINHMIGKLDAYIKSNGKTSL